jgi:hypothetical protein
MILFLEISLFVWGLMAIINGKMRIGVNCYLYNGTARWMGALALSQLPLAYCFAIILGVLAGTEEIDIDDDSLFWTMILLEIGSLAGIFGFIKVVGTILGRPYEMPSDIVELEAASYQRNRAAEKLPHGSRHVPLMTAKYFEKQQPQPEDDREEEEVAQPRKPSRTRWQKRY